MPGIGIGIGMGKEMVRLDADAASFIARAGITNPTQVNAVNSLVLGFKVDGTWNSFNAVYPIVGGNASAHAQNLKNSSHTITWINAPTHNSAGVTGNGTTQYGDTNFPATSLNPTNVHVAAYCSGTSAPGDTIGIFDGVAYVLQMEPTIGSFGAFIFDVNNLADGRMTGNTDGLALNIATRTSISAAAAYVRGANVGSKAGAVGAMTMPAGNIFVLARNSIGSGPVGFISATMSFASIGSGLTAGQALSYHNRVQAFQTALGRAV